MSGNTSFFSGGPGTTGREVFEDSTAVGPSPLHGGTQHIANAAEGTVGSGIGRRDNVGPVGEDGPAGGMSTSVGETGRTGTTGEGVAALPMPSNNRTESLDRMGPGGTTGVPTEHHHHHHHGHHHHGDNQGAQGVDSSANLAGQETHAHHSHENDGHLTRATGVGAAGTGVGSGVGTGNNDNLTTSKDPSAPTGANSASVGSGPGSSFYDNSAVNSGTTAAKRDAERGSTSVNHMGETAKEGGLIDKPVTTDGVTGYGPLITGVKEGATRGGGNNVDTGNAEDLHSGTTSAMRTATRGPTDINPMGETAREGGLIDKPMPNTGATGFTGLTTGVGDMSLKDDANRVGNQGQDSSDYEGSSRAGPLTGGAAGTDRFDVPSSDTAAGDTGVTDTTKRGEGMSSGGAAGVLGTSDKDFTARDRLGTGAYADTQGTFQSNTSGPAGQTALTGREGTPEKNPVAQKTGTTGTPASDAGSQKKKGLFAKVKEALS